MKLKTLMLLTMTLASLNVYADTFEIVDGGAAVTGAPNSNQSQARDNWQAQCDQWKQETKDLNKNNQLLNISCESPTCAWQAGNYTCTSQAVYKLEIAGSYSTPPPAPTPVVTETVVTTPPPAVIVETVPVPRPGFIWITGYWGWAGSRHSWYPGRWEHVHPGFVYVQPRWIAHGGGWRFNGGHWRR